VIPVARTVVPSSAMISSTPEQASLSDRIPEAESSCIASVGNSNGQHHEIRNQFSALPSLSTTSIPLQDMPDEILQQITAFLWSEPSEEWHEFRDPSFLTRCQNPEMRRDAIAFSSCCKNLRRSVFRDSLITTLTAKLSYEDLLELESASSDLRGRVR
jgi:hypothetical protein